MAAATAPEPTTGTSVEDRNKLVRRHVLAKLTTKNHTKVDIKPIGPNRFRVNVWAETGKKSEGEFFTEKRIVETFVHFE